MSMQSEMWKLADKPEPCSTWARYVDPDGWYDASVRWDGCINFRRYFNLPLDEPTRNEIDVDCIHICDLDETIERLQALRKLATSYFVGQHGWPRWPDFDEMA